MSRCPVGENCAGCQYAEHCAHPEVQAERLRADVRQPSRRRRRLTRERDAARFDAAKLKLENDCLLLICGFLPLSIREAVKRGDLTACREWAKRGEDLANETSERLRAEVERIKRERDEALRHLEVHRGLELELCETRGALSDARRAALEEAAGIVEQAALHERLKPRRNEVVEIAAAIRAAAKEER